MSWQCENCRHYTADGERHICINDLYNKALAEIKRLKLELLPSEEDKDNDDYDRGFLDGSKVGDDTAKAFKKERDEDMDRLQAERIKIYKDNQTLRTRLAIAVEALKSISGMQMFLIGGAESHSGWTKEANVALSKISELNKEGV